MAASNNNNAHKPELTLPTSIAQTMRLVQRVAHSATWGERIARHHQPPPAADFGPRLFRRFDAATAPGQWADAFAQRFVADELPPSSSSLPLAPHAPAQRQVSAARQGALTWSGGDAFASPASSFSGQIDRFADADASQSLIGDLMGSGWGVQSARADTLRRVAEPAAPVQPQSSAPIRRTPQSPDAAKIDRQADTPAAPESSAAPAAAGSAIDSGSVQRSADSAADAPSTATSTAAAADATPPIETAGTRPMTLFRGTPQSPLMRMGLSESSSGSDAPEAPATINRQPASGELPVVRPARGSDDPSFPAPVPTSAASNRRAEQQSPQITSSNIIERTSDQARSDSAASPEIRRSASDQPEVQGQAATESSAPAADSTIDRSTEAQVAQAPVQRSAAPTSSANVESTPASVEPRTTTNGSAAQPASTASADVIARSTSDATPAVQRTAADATAAAEENATPTGSAPAQRAPVIHRQPAQPARASSIDTVLPLANRLLQRYSAGSSQGTSGSMPLLRTFAPTTTAVMRSAAPIMSSTVSVQTSGTNAAPGASSGSSTSLPPLVHRSPIVPMLPAATLQREPATGGTASAATPAPRAAAPALEWSAIPLLQRLSGAHALPATPAAGGPTASVAAQVINRLALDQPGAAPMPLLRMHAPSIARTADVPAATTLMRAPGEAPADSAPGFGADATAGQSVTNDDAGSQGAGLGAQPTGESAGFGVASTPAIHRSAILPSLSSAAFQPLTLLRVQTPDAPSMAQADLAHGSSPLQRSPDAPSSLAPSAGPSLPPLVHHSPIVPVVLTTTVQREPASGATSADATPALEWSALPLLQRVSNTHVLPATPAASNASVAAHVINRLALDQPGVAPMPLLRMHAPSEPPMLSRETAPSTVETTDSAASATESLAAQPSVMSSLVRRSAILPSSPSVAAQAESVGVAASPAAEISGGALQRSPAADYALPMLQRTSVQRFLGSRPALKLPSLGGIQNSVNSLAGQAQGMVNQVTGMPNQLMGQAQGMIDQVTGMPNQLMGQAQGMIDQVTGMPNQLMGQAQGMIDQVTGMPNQLMGQAQGMIDQVTGMPNQLMGQAQGMLGQVSGLPGQMQDAASNLVGARSAQLTLLRPVRSESQSAPVRDQDEAQGETATGSLSSSAASGASGGGAQGAGEAGKAGKPDIDMLAQQVYARLRHRLLIDRERLGR